jgi:hypothetical protein
MTVELLAVAGLVGGEGNGELPVLGHERHLLDQGASVGKTDGPSRGHPAGLASPFQRAGRGPHSDGHHKYSLDFGKDTAGFNANVRFQPEPTGPRTTCRQEPAMHQNAATAPLATAHDDVANTRERRALLADARWAVRRQHAAEVVCRLRTLRQGGAAVVDELTVA